MTQWLYRWQDAPEGKWGLSVGAEGSTTELEGWKHTGIKAADTTADQELTLPKGKEERFIVPIHGAFSVVVDGVRHQLRGRPSAFAGPTDVIYVGIDHEVTIISEGDGRVAVASAPATVAYPTKVTKAEDVPVELRGNGPTSREIHNFGTVGQAEADKVIVCEVITPGGNWSSYPPHKHDEITDTENALEEIYYYEVRSTEGAPADADPFAVQRVSTADQNRPIEICDEVRSGDCIFIPYGWHGPSMAAPGYDLYYLNVMAGPGAREWNVTVDPHDAWVNDSLTGQPIDPRLPLH